MLIGWIAILIALGRTVPQPCGPTRQANLARVPGRHRPPLGSLLEPTPRDRLGLARRALPAFRWPPFWKSARGRGLTRACLCRPGQASGPTQMRSVGISRACFCWRADPLVDHLPDLLVQLVLLPDAVGGPQQHRRDRHQPDRPADRRIDPLVAAQADAQLALSGGEDHGQRVGDPQQVAPQALLARLHDRAVPAGAEDLCLELVCAEVVGQRPGELVGRDGGAVDPLNVQRRPLASPRFFALLCGHGRSPSALAAGNPPHVPRALWCQTPAGQGRWRGSEAACTTSKTIARFQARKPEPPRGEPPIGIARACWVAALDGAPERSFCAPAVRRSSGAVQRDASVEEAPLVRVAGTGLRRAAVTGWPGVDRSAGGVLPG